MLARRSFVIRSSIKELIPLQEIENTSNGK